MGKKSSAGSSGPARKILSLSYYLRKPHRLAFLCLFIVLVLFGFADHHSNVLKSETLSRHIQELEGETEKLEAELVKTQMDGSQLDTPSGVADGQSTGKLLRGVTKQLPLILGVTPQTRSGTVKLKKAAEGDHGASKLSRKLLPDEKLLKGGSQESEEKDGNSGKTAAQVDNGEESDDFKKDVSKETSKDPEAAKNEQRRQEIRWGMIHAWGAYEQYAWGYDELMPQSKHGVNQFGGLGASIVDSLDTLYIMGLREQFDKARKWVFDNMDFDKNYDASVFETTIRVLGGLLSAYDLSGDEGFLRKARELGDRLLPAWDTSYGLPWNYLNLGSGKGYNAGWTGGSSILADSGTTTVEMIALSQRTGDPKYGAKAERVIKHIESIFPEDGLVPLFISPDTGRPTTGKISIGAMGDSFYEYLLKVWVQGGKTTAVKKYRKMWEQSMQGMKALVQKTGPSGLTYVAERVNGQLINKMDHLACFIPGMLVLGAEGEKEEEYMSLAKELAVTCYAFYERMPSKLSGEHYLFYEAEPGQDLQVGHGYNIGRPETVESLMYLWRKTKDPIYREWGWNIWQAFQKHCRLQSGYTGLRDVNRDPPEKDDMMQSFFLAETLKYLYLLFSPDDVIPLDKWVFNTEAHPVRIVPRNSESLSEGIDKASQVDNEGKKQDES